MSETPGSSGEGGRAGVSALHSHDCADPLLHGPAPLKADLAASQSRAAAAIEGLGDFTAPGRRDPLEAAKVTRRITAYSVCVGLILVALKTFIYGQSESVGVLSSLVHSALDFGAALATFFGVRYAARAPDKQHSFGRGKAEGFIAILQACLVVFSAGHIAEEAIERLINPQTVSNGFEILVGMSLAIMLTFWLLMAQSHAINATGSVAIRGDRAHYLSDMASNIAVIVGAGLAAFTPFARADGLVALGIALWLLFTAFRVGKLAFNQLMDKELPEPERAFITALVTDDPAIRAVKDLRTRASGPHVHVQMHIEIDPNLSLLEAHTLVTQAEARVLFAFPAADITIHPDPAGHSHGNSRFRRED